MRGKIRRIEGIGRKMDGISIEEWSNEPEWVESLWCDDRNWWVVMSRKMIEGNSARVVLKVINRINAG